MITTDRQYKAAQIQLEKLRHAIDTFDEQAAIDSGTHPQIARAHLASLGEAHAEVCGDIAAYEQLTTTRPGTFKAKSLAELPEVLIKARIAQRLTQADLAARLDMKEQQIQRYEANLYHGASLARLSEIAKALSVSFAVEAKLATAERTRIFKAS